jgi:hypothetical protein
MRRRVASAMKALLLLSSIVFWLDAGRAHAQLSHDDPCELAETHWTSVESIDTAEAYQDHLSRFPGCVFSALAKLRIEQLKGRQSPPATASTDLQDVLSKIVADNNLRRERANTPTRMSVELQPDGVLVWRFAVHSCFQKISRAKLSDLDLRSAKISDHEFGMYLDVPCKGGRSCVREDTGAVVWPIIAVDQQCKDRKVTTQHQRNFKPGAVPATYREELRAALRR